MGELSNMDERLIDPATGELVDAVPLTQLREAERDLRKARTRNTKLEKQIAGTDGHSPRASAIREVFDYWVQVMGKNANTVLGDERSRAVKNRLEEGFTVDALKEAIEGAARDDWAMGRAAKASKAGYHDLGDHICARAATVERFRAIHRDRDKPQQFPKLTPGRKTGSSGPKVWSPFDDPLDRMLELLRREFGGKAYHAHDLVPGHKALWTAICPVKPDSHSMFIEEREFDGHTVGGEMNVKCLVGCSLSTIRDAFDVIERRQFVRRRLIEEEQAEDAPQREEAAQEDLRPIREYLDSQAAA